MENGIITIFLVITLFSIIAVANVSTIQPTSVETTTPSTTKAVSTTKIITQAIFKTTPRNKNNNNLTTPFNNSSSPILYTNLGLGIGLGVLGFFLLLSFILLMSCFCCKPFPCNCKKDTISDIEDDSLPMQPFAGEMIASIPPRDPRPTPVQDLIALLRERRKNKTIYLDEFNSLPPSSRPRLKSCSEAASHPSKNRYTDILPFNDDRVKLQNLQDDYINASYVDGFEKENEFIATQGPLRETCDQFWMLVWEQKSEKIIMVANILEDGMPKCAPYFPYKKNEGISAKVITFKNICVTLNKEEDFEEYVRREFNIQKGNEKRVVEQYHFTDWPDKGVPETCTSLLRFRKVCLGAMSSHEKPVVIHCSAGVGRTGTLLATDILLKEAEKNGSIDVGGCVDKMRRKRMAMVQTLSQYIFTFHTVVESLMLGDVSMKPDKFMIKYEDLEKPEKYGKSYLELQFELLEASKPFFSENSFSSGMSHKEHNRFSTILPIDDFMPLVSTPSNDYINAVHVSGFKGYIEIIGTQSPMPGHFETFWNLVKEHKCTVVVMLNDLLENEPKYWPDDGLAELHGQMAVMNAGEISSDDIVASDFRVSNLTSKSEEDDSPSESKSEESGMVNEGYDQSSEGSEDIVKNRISKDLQNLHVRHFRLSGWDEKHYPKDKIASLLSLTAEVRRCLKRVPEGSLLVHCLNGADKSGIFCALLNLLWKMEVSGEIDVHNAVKIVQKRRPEFVNSPEQLKYLYEIAHHFLSSIQPAG